MAFKMKGSAFKLGNVPTKSALKQKEADASALKDYSQNRFHSQADSYNEGSHPHQERERGRGGLVETGAKVKAKERKKETEAAPKMKSPAKQKEEKKEKSKVLSKFAKALTKPTKTRINPKTGKHEKHTGSKIDPITRKKTETYSTYQ